jgi:DNA adenine methylase
VETKRTYHSPLRYPGGKSWLAPTIVDELRRMKNAPKVFLEPFAGGASVGLAILMYSLCEHLVLVEKDQDVAALWEVIFSSRAEQLARRIIEFDPTREHITSVLEAAPKATADRAFRILLRNRVTHGGRLTRSGGLLRNGERGNGVLSRWYPVTIATRIRMLARLSDFVTVVHGDGIDTMREHAGRKTTCMFVDPPYTADAKDPGTRLYEHFDIDHEAVFKLGSRGETPVFLTYADSKIVRSLARQYNFRVRPVVMRTTHHNERTELLLTKRRS